MKWHQHDPDPSLRTVCTEDKRFFLFRLTSWLWICWICHSYSLNL